MNPCNDTFGKQAPNELVIKVTPTGIDDTKNIQCALLWAVDTGMPVVKPSDDTFYISGLQIRNFKGSLQGTTTDSTMLIIRDRSVACVGMGASGQIPAAIKLIMGEPRLRYMTIKAHRAASTNTNVSTNSFTGNGASALLVQTDDPVTGWTITANKGLNSFTSGPAGDIYLGAKTSRFIVGPGQGATVTNLGTNNNILSSDKPSPEANVKTD